MTFWQRWCQSQAHRAGKRVDKIEERGMRQQWFLLAGWRERSACSAPRPETLQPIYAPNHASWADPFAWCRDGSHCVFVEELPYPSGRGHISVIKLNRELQPVGEAIPVVQEPYHLSYPFLFEFNGELFMVPETAAVNRVDLYRCVVFPHRWAFVKTLIDGVRIADSTIHEHEGRWWLFCTARQGRVRMNESLCAFHANNPLSDRWTPHPANPLVRYRSRGRPAGRIFGDDEGRLLRPSQDCVRRYGYGLNLSEIMHLSPSRYSERLVWHASGEEVGGWRAMHHLDWHQGLMVMDAQRLLPLDSTAH